MNTFVVTILASFPAVISFIFIMMLVFKKNKTLMIFSYMFIQAMMLIWSTGQALELNAKSLEGRWLFIQYEYLGVCFVGFSWIIFCILYTYKHWISVKLVLLLALLPATCYVMLLTNQHHFMFFTEYDLTNASLGPVFWIQVLITYVYIFFGDVLLFVYSFQKQTVKKNEIVLLTMASIIPIVPNILFLTNIIGREYDFTPSAFSVSLVIFLYVIFKYRFLNILPMAQSVIFNSMEDAIIITDHFSQIVSVNSAGQNFFLEHKMDLSFGKKHFLQEVLYPWIWRNTHDRQIIDSLKADILEYFNFEIKMNAIEPKYYNILIQPIRQNEYEAVGKIVTLRDITEHRRLINEVHEKNEELSAANEELIALNDQLTEYSQATEELAIANERNRLSKEIHDTLGHSMITLITLLEAADLILGQNVQDAREKIRTAMKIARDGMVEIRRSISGLVPARLETSKLFNALNALVTEFASNSGVVIILSIDKALDNLAVSISNSIYRICQEALTNSIRHGKATEINIIIKSSENYVKLYIIDNGCGSNDTKKGFGLRGMEDRVRLLNGSIAYGSGEGGGFNIRIRVPIS